jgi:hypothetical protein
MIRSALILCAGIIVAASFACTPSPPFGGSPIPGSPKPLATCDGTDLSSRVQFVQSGAVTTTASLTSAMTADLQNAYCQAPDVFRHHINSVDYIYIDITGCQPVAGVMTCPLASGAANGSWGMRVSGGYTQIGIPVGIWGQTPWVPSTPPPAEQYTTFETASLQYLVQQKLGSYSDSNDLPYFSSAPSGSALGQSWMTVLAALAHELGHVRWYAVNYRSGWGQPYDFYKLNHCQVGTSLPNLGFFAGWKYQTPKYLTLKKRWRDFGNTATDTQNDHGQAPLFSDYINATTDALKEKIVNSLYSPGEPWASFLSANVPEEDFVETYKLDILMKAGLTSMPLMIPLGNGTSTTKEDIPGELYNNGNPTLMPTLSDKISCLKTAR